MTTYRGQPVEYAVHNPKPDTYSLIGVDGACLAELKAREFLSIPNRGNLEVRSGRYRRAGSKNQRSANRVAGQSGGDDAFDAFLYAAGSQWPNASASKNPATSLTAKDIQAAARLIAQQSAPWFSSRILQAFSELEVVNRPALKRDGVIAGEIVGYRCWRIKRGDPHTLIGRLRSVYQSDVWNPGEVLQGREMGDWDSRGIHAWKNSGSKEYHDYIRSYLNRENDTFFLWSPNNEPVDTRPAMVTGTVFLWGDVVEHERGWRAEFARVRSLDWLYPDAPMMGREVEALGALRKLYGVPSKD